MRARPSWRGVLRIALPVCVSAALLWVLRSFTSDEAAAAAWSRARPGALLGAAALFLLGLLLNGLPWRRLVAGDGPLLPISRVFSLDLSSMFWGTVLPGSLGGELIKGARLSRGLPDLPRVGLALLCARLIGAAAAATVALPGLLWTALPTDRARGVLLVLLAMISVVCVVLIGMNRGLDALLRRSPWLTARWPAAEPPRPSALLQAYALALPAHACFAACYALSAAAVGVRLGPADAGWTYVLASLAMVPPVTFAGLGARELSVAAAVEAVTGAGGGAMAALGVSAVHLGITALAGILELVRALRPAASAAPPPPRSPPPPPS